MRQHRAHGDHAKQVEIPPQLYFGSYTILKYKRFNYTRLILFS